MLEYAFMRKALYVGFLLSIAIPMIGIVVVNRKTSTIGDALSHTSLAGISLGLILGFNPVVGAIIACVVAALSIDAIRLRFPKNGDMATAIIMSTGIGLASVLSDFVPGVQNFQSFLFGSIVAISNEEVVLVTLTAIFVILGFIRMYYALLYISIDKTGARMAGIPTKVTEFLFTMMLSVTIAISSRTVGVLMVSSLMVLPVASALLFSKSYRQTVLWSIVYGMVYVMGGLILSDVLALKPGGTIVLLGVFGLLVTLFVTSVLKRIRREQRI